MSILKINQSNLYRLTSHVNLLSTFKLTLYISRSHRSTHSLLFLYFPIQFFPQYTDLPFTFYILPHHLKQPTFYLFQAPRWASLAPKRVTLTCVWRTPTVPPAPSIARVTAGPPVSWTTARAKLAVAAEVGCV